MREYTLHDFDYALPPELIALHPSPSRSASRLLQVGAARDDIPGAATLTDRRFAELPQLLRRGDLIVLNDTRVIAARLGAQRETGGRVELLLERIEAPDLARFQLRASHPPRAGESLALDGGASATVVDRSDRFFRLRLDGALAIDEYLRRHGAIPLPPYIARPAAGSDAERYQTVYARNDGAVAAPTAGLHFDAEMLSRVAEAEIAIATLTLHVGAGTFLPVTSEKLSEHAMHAERYRIPAATFAAIEAARRRGGRVIAVGTTTLRALESAARDGDPADRDAETALFIVPGFAFRVVDLLLTNFHLPRSTLLMLVSAFAGPDTIRRGYAHAIAHRYRFYSYGDAMLLERASGV